MKKGMKASSLRSLLIFLLFLLIAAIAGGFYLGLQQVKKFSLEVSHTTADANASGTAIQELQALKQSLAESESLVSKANQVFSTEATYQSQALKDVKKYASTYGLTISNTNFDAPAPSSGVGRNFVITLQSPVPYANLLRFLDAIEGNLPKMQIANLEISRPTSGDAGSTVAVGDVTIEIATR